MQECIATEHEQRLENEAIASIVQQTFDFGFCVIGIWHYPKPSKMMSIGKLLLLLSLTTMAIVGIVAVLHTGYALLPLSIFS